MSSKDPLGLPKGSVRSIIALGLTAFGIIAGLGALFVGLLNGLIEDPTSIVLFVLGLSNAAVLFYFNKRDEQ